MGLWIGETLGEFVEGRESGICGVFVESRFCCCMKRCILFVVMALFRFFVLRDLLRPYKVEKFMRLMAQINFERKGLHAVVCRKVTSSDLVEFESRSLQASC